MRDSVIIAGEMIDTPLYEQWGWDYAPHHAKWLTDLLWWSLGKFGALKAHMGMVHQYRFQGHVKEQMVLDAIMKAVDVREVYRNPKDYAIIMGIETYYELMSLSTQSMPPVGFSFDAGPFGYQNTVFGLQIHVVTTLSGIACIPKILIEKRVAA